MQNTKIKCLLEENLYAVSLTEVCMDTATQVLCFAYTQGTLAFQEISFRCKPPPWFPRTAFFHSRQKRMAPHACKFTHIFGASLAPTHSQQVNHREMQDLTLNSFAFSDITSTLDESWCQRFFCIQLI